MTQAVDYLQLRKIFEANRLFMDKRQEINASLINTFLGVCIWGEDPKGATEISITELAAKIGLPETTVSRHVRYLGQQERVGVEGMGLLDTKVHPIDRRRKIVFLTRGGRNLRDQLAFLAGDTTNVSPSTGS